MNCWKPGCNAAAGLRYPAGELRPEEYCSSGHSRPAGEVTTALPTKRDVAAMDEARDNMVKNAKKQMRKHILKRTKEQRSEDGKKGAKARWMDSLGTIGRAAPKGKPGERLREIIKASVEEHWAEKEAV